MKYICLLALLSLMIIPMSAASNNQNQLNITYLDNLDLKLVDFIDLIVAFNSSANNMKGHVQDAEQFSQFLLNLTMELSSLRKTISLSVELDDVQREETILSLMAELKPQAIKIYENVDNEQDRTNSKYLDQRIVKLHNQLKSYRAEIIKSEKSIEETLTISDDFISLHNRHFVYQLLLCFAQDYQILSKINRQFLADLIQKIDLNIYKQKL
jgi:hypothetical protein